MDRTIEPLYHEIGRRVRLARRQSGYTLLDMARCIGLANAGCLSDLERGRSRIQLHTLYAVARVLQVSLDELLPDVDKS